MSDELATLFRDRVADEHPDLDALTRVATQQGTRIRRVRRASVALGAAAGVAAIVGLGAVLAGGATTAGGTPRFAGSPGSSSSAAPAPPSLHAGMVLHLPSGATMKVLAADDVRGLPLTAHVILDRADGLYLEQASSRVTVGDLSWLARNYRLDSTAPNGKPRLLSDGDAGIPKREPKPAKVTLRGWSCGPAVDQKFLCTGPRGQSDEVTWHLLVVDRNPPRGEADKRPNWSSAVHNSMYITISGPHAAALGASLVWK